MNSPLLSAGKHMKDSGRCCRCQHLVYGLDDGGACATCSADRRLVGAPLNCGAYPKHFYRSNKLVAHTHIFELDSDGTPLRVLCGKVALGSYYEDTTQHVTPRDVSCRLCSRAFIRQLLSAHSDVTR